MLLFKTSSTPSRDLGAEEPAISSAVTSQLSPAHQQWVQTLQPKAPLLRGPLPSPTRGGATGSRFPPTPQRLSLQKMPSLGQPPCASSPRVYSCNVLLPRPRRPALVWALTAAAAWCFTNASSPVSAVSCVPWSLPSCPTDSASPFAERRCGDHPSPGRPGITAISALTPGSPASRLQESRAFWSYLASRRRWEAALLTPRPWGPAGRRHKAAPVGRVRPRC